MTPPPFGERPLIGHAEFAKPEHLHTHYLPGYRVLARKCRPIETIRDRETVKRSCGAAKVFTWQTYGDRSLDRQLQHADPGFERLRNLMIEQASLARGDASA